MSVKKELMKEIRSWNPNTDMGKGPAWNPNTDMGKGPVTLAIFVVWAYAQVCNHVRK